MQPQYKHTMQELDIKGTVLLAPEGINGTVSALPQNMQRFIDILKADIRLQDMPIKLHDFRKHAFERTKVKLREEIIDIGVKADPLEISGSYVEPKDWNNLISRDDVVLIDTRNDYEYNFGHFKNAIDPTTKKFHEIKKYVDDNKVEWQDKKIAMYCTGGVRCEKFSNYMIKEGFDQVYHLKGGILKYLEEVPQQDSTWQGECYVFDERVTVDHNLQASPEKAICGNCKSNLFTKDRIHPDYIPNKQCPYCA